MSETLKPTLPNMDQKVVLTETTSLPGNGCLGVCFDVAKMMGLENFTRITDGNGNDIYIPSAQEGPLLID